MNVENKEQEHDNLIELQKKEKIIQTIILLYSLLLVFNQNMGNETRAITIVNYMMFLFASLLYYYIITIPKKKKL